MFKVSIHCKYFRFNKSVSNNMRLLQISHGVKLTKWFTTEKLTNVSVGYIITPHSGSPDTLIAQT